MVMKVMKVMMMMIMMKVMMMMKNYQNKKSPPHVINIIFDKQRVGNEGRIFTSYYPGPVLAHTGQPHHSLRKVVQGMTDLIFIQRCLKI